MGRAGSGALPSSPDPVQGMIMQHRQQLHRMQKLNISRQHNNILVLLPSSMALVLGEWWCLLSWLWCSTELDGAKSGFPD